VEELHYVLKLGFNPSRIILTHPFKSLALLQFARINGVSLLSFDTVDELEAIHGTFSDAELLLRIATYEVVDGNRKPSYFGIVAEDVSLHLEAANQLGLRVVGVSFHCEAGGEAAGGFQKGIIEAIESVPSIFKKANEFGFNPTIVDIGGSFVGQRFAQVASAISQALCHNLTADVRIIGEPGRFMVDSSTTIACKVLGLRRPSSGRIEIPAVICTNCSVFEDFAMFVTDYVDAYTEPFRLQGQYLSWNDRRVQLANPTTYMITGSSLFAIDEVVKMAKFHQLVKVGDWICFRQMGAYSSPPSARVGGNSRAVKLYIPAR
jgi:ornithine decarboxylase